MSGAPPDSHQRYQQCGPECRVDTEGVEALWQAMSRPDFGRSARKSETGIPHSGPTNKQ